MKILLIPMFLFFAAEGADSWLQRALSKSYATSQLAEWEAVHAPPPKQNAYVLQLVEFLKQESKKTGRNQVSEAASLLGSLGTVSKPALPLLIEIYMKTTIKNDQSAILSSLFRIGATPESAAFFLPLLSDSSEVYSDHAASVLADLDPPPSGLIAASLERFGKIEVDYLLMSAARSLFKVKKWTQADKEKLKGLLAPDQPGNRRLAAAWLLQQVAPEQTIDTQSVYNSLSHSMGTQKCEFEGRKVSIETRSFSGEYTEDDASVWFLQDGFKPVFAGFDGEVASFSFLVAKKGSPCSVLSFNSGGKIIIPLLTDDRPFDSQMAIIVYDPKTSTVLGSRAGMGQVSGSTKNIEPVPGGFLFESTLRPSDSGACKGSCGKFHGKAVKSATDEWIGVWWDVTLDEKHHEMSKRLNLQRTWEKSPIKKYFASPKDFAKGFYIDADKGQVGTYWYHHLDLVDGKRWLCISKVRGQNDSDCFAAK